MNQLEDNQKNITEVKQKIKMSKKRKAVKVAATRNGNGANPLCDLGQAIPKNLVSGVDESPEVKAMRRRQFASGL